MDAGGLMAYNSYTQAAQSTQPTLGVPNSGFGSRGKNSHLRNISVPVPNPQDQPSVTTPRSGRAQLLAGLRTQPKTPTTTPATGAFLSENLNGIDSSKYGGLPRTSTFPPKTARGLGLGASSASALSNQYSPALPTPPASSPAITMNGETLYDQQQELADAQAYAEMLATTNYILARRQQQLQQLLLAQQAQQLQQQLAGLQLQSPLASTFATPPMSPGIGMFTPAAQSVPTVTSGVYQVFNPLTGQVNYYVPTQQAQAQQQPQQQAPQQQQQRSETQQQQQLTMAYQQLQASQGQQQLQHIEPNPPAPQKQLQSSNTASMSSSRSNSRSRSPPKLREREKPQGLSSSTFRKGHRKASSLSSCVNANNVEIEEAPKTSVPFKLSMQPSTPMTATFAPGHASGSHPVRQPRGPPNIEEIKAKPTSKHEGSKNFASRQRRKAISRLITAGLERRGNRPMPGGVMTPVSENDGGFIFEDGDSVASSLSGRQSLQSLREGPDSPPGYSASSLSSDEGTIGGKLVEIKESYGGLRTPQLILESTDKRKSAMF